MSSANDSDAVRPEDAARLLSRLVARDPGLWSDDPTVRSAIEGRLGWLDAIAFSRDQLQRLQRFAKRVRRENFDRVVLLGMGGSSLAPEVFNRCFPDAPGRLDMTVLDTTFPDTVDRTRAALEGGRPLFIVSSKSGATAETSALSRYFWHWSGGRPDGGAGSHFAAITDPGSALHRTAAEHGFLEVFLNPPDIGGRYSALSLFGLVPAVLAGVDVPRLLDRAEAMLSDPDDSVAAAGLGVLVGRRASRGRDKLALEFSPRLETVGMWVEQLVAESTGKQGTGVVPVLRTGAGQVPAGTGDECAYVATRHRLDSAAEDARGPNGNGGPSAFAIAIDDAHELGAEFMRWQIATAVAAAVMGVNPFDEPDVNATKKATAGFLGRGVPAGTFAADGRPEPATLGSFLERVGPGDYVAILAYLPTDQPWCARLQPLRDAIARRVAAATCVALGPRYLHSTGQLHKGGRKNGHFLVLTARPSSDVPIPDEHYGFGDLIDAQARGDISVLRERGQHVLHWELGPVAGAASEVDALVRCVAG